MPESTALITNDAVVLGLLMAILAFVFHTSHSDSPRWKKFYKYVPSLLLCYFIPSIFNSLGIISGMNRGCISSPRATCCRPVSSCSP